ncbi:hypothetical protein NOR_02924 [Metarhizium rileyi]|uniref:Uncharacterized protein n=1 Tax=Metarhizium rileyi (strain RCEF 4871) TaxID=1649241 RepID=A0A167G560_METRR|nr:hypothetical protein NOR_02924 [Metarhizium rileyi RCEF 4871]
MSSASAPVYTSRDAARAAYSGACITAWPADEPYVLPPPVEELEREMRMGYRNHPGDDGASSKSSTESLTSSTTPPLS